MVGPVDPPVLIAEHQEILDLLTLTLTCYVLRVPPAAQTVKTVAGYRLKVIWKMVAFEIEKVVKLCVIFRLIKLFTGGEEDILTMIDHTF
jgi:hypothetical protein